MRRPRKVLTSTEVPITYHCITRIVDKQFLLTDDVKAVLDRFTNESTLFCGISKLTHHYMDNHMHLVIDVPAVPSQMPNDDQLLELLGCLTTKAARSYEKQLRRFRSMGDDQAAEVLRQRLFKQMWSLSGFMKLLLQRFSQWYNKTHNRTGTLFEGRFKCKIFNGRNATACICAYVDLNSKRAGIVGDPKDYRWGGYGAALRDDPIAIKGITEICARLTMRPSACVTKDEALSTYRVTLAHQGHQNEGTNELGQPFRRGFTDEEVAEILASKGMLTVEQCASIKACMSSPIVADTKQAVEEFLKKNTQYFSPRANVAVEYKLPNGVVLYGIGRPPKKVAVPKKKKKLLKEAAAMA
jgi:putative transposase